MEDDVLDESWIRDFQENDKLYEKYYLDDVYHIKVNSIYIDTSRNILNAKEDRILMNQLNVLTRDELLSIVKKNSVYNRNQFQLYTILKYNMDLDPTEVEDFLKKPAPPKPFLSLVSHIEDVPFHKTISMFQDLNDLYCVYRQKDPNDRKNKTKKSKKTNKQITS